MAETQGHRHTRHLISKKYSKGGWFSSAVSRNPEVIIDRGFLIKYQQAFTTPIDIPRHGRLDIALEIFEGPAVDIFLTDRAGVHDYEVGDDVRTYREFTIKKTRAKAYHRNIEPGRYGLVIENTGSGGLLSRVKREHVTGLLRVTFE